MTKQTGELFKKLDEANSHLDDDMRDETFYALLNDLHAAQAELPDYDKLAETPEGQRLLEESEYAELFDNYYIDKVYEWRKKWFGEKP